MATSYEPQKHKLSEAGSVQQGEEYEPQPGLSITSHDGILHLQRIIGNRALIQLLRLSSQAYVQRGGIFSTDKGSSSPSEEEQRVKAEKWKRKRLKKKDKIAQLNAAAAAPAAAAAAPAAAAAAPAAAAAAPAAAAAAPAAAAAAAAPVIDAEDDHSDPDGDAPAHPQPRPAGEAAPAGGSVPANTKNNGHKPQPTHGIDAAGAGSPAGKSKSKKRRERQKHHAPAAAAAGGAAAAPREYTNTGWAAHCAEVMASFNQGTRVSGVKNDHIVTQSSVLECLPKVEKSHQWRQGTDTYGDQLRIFVEVDAHGHRVKNGNVAVAWGVSHDQPRKSGNYWVYRLLSNNKFTHESGQIYKDDK